MCDNARKRIRIQIKIKNTNKIQIKKKEETWEPVLQRADIFWARPTHLGPTPRKETRKGTVYQTGSHVHAGKAMTISENNNKSRRYLKAKNWQIK